MTFMSVPLFFTALALLGGFIFVFFIRPRASRHWSAWDTRFVMGLVLSIMLPAWMVYREPMWQIAVLWTVTSFVVAHFAPVPVEAGYTRTMGKQLQYYLAGVATVVAWLTWMILFCESHWRQAAQT